MTDAQVSITLDGSRRQYFPGEVLSGEYRLIAARGDEIEALEISVVWHSEGKGGEDLAVHYFKRFANTAEAPIEPRQPQRFSTILPNSPLSYDGMIVKIVWSVRVRLFLTSGEEIAEDHRFQLGNIPRAQPIES